MEYLHTMVRVSDIDDSLKFYCDGLGLAEMRRVDHEAGRFTLVFLATPRDAERCTDDLSAGFPAGLPMVELTYNWDPEQYAGGRNFGHLAYRVDDIYQTCRHLQSVGVAINRPPRDGRMAFVLSPDGVSVELLQKGEPLAPAEPWASMENVGHW